MIRMNLATKPFYNERIVLVTLGLLGAAALVLLAVGALRARTFAADEARLSAALEADETQATAVRNAVAGLQREIGPAGLDDLAAAAAEANAVIEARLFSWTAFFNVIEATLPADVMLTSLRPEVDEGEVVVALGVVGRSVDALDQFIALLERSGAFRDVLTRREEIIDDGSYRATILGRYVTDTGGGTAGED